jgi:hypothetical protein
MCAEECYVNDGIVFAVVDNLPLTLQHLVQLCTLYPTEGQLGSIIAQVCPLVRRQLARCSN